MPVDVGRSKGILFARRSSHLGSPNYHGPGPPPSRSKRNKARHLWFVTFDAILAVPANHWYQIPSDTGSTPSLAPEAPTEAGIEAAPDPVESLIPEVVPGPPQENGYRSLLPEDEIPNLQTILASCGQLMISLR